MALSIRQATQAARDGRPGAIHDGRPPADRRGRAAGAVRLMTCGAQGLLRCVAVRAAAHGGDSAGQTLASQTHLPDRCGRRPCHNPMYRLRDLATFAAKVSVSMFFARQLCRTRQLVAHKYHTHTCYHAIKSATTFLLLNFFPAGALLYRFGSEQAERTPLLGGQYTRR